MTQTDNATTDTLANSPLARLASVLLILATLYICYFHNLGAIGLVGPDEPRYAWIARSMAETGDWVTPRLYGQPWFEKPVLYYWAAALNFKLFGVSEATARLPSAIAALLATLAMAWLAWRVYGAETARWLLLLVPTTVGMIGFSHAAATDMPFAGMLAIAMVVAARLLGLVQKSFTSFTSSTSFDSCLFGFFLGLAVLAKGPAAIVLSAGSVLLWAAFTKRWNDAFRCLHPLAIASFCLTALPWYILCAHRNPDFFRIFIIEHNFKRFLTPEFQHIQPFWFYIPVILLALLPWTVSAAPLVVTAKLLPGPDSWLNSSRLFFACWAVFPIVFFTLSKSKLPGYILPSIPALGLLMAHSVSLCIRKILPGERWIRIATGSTFIAFGILGIVQIERIDLAWPVLAFTIGGFAILVLRNLRFGLALGVSALIIAIVSSLTGNTRAVLDQLYSARSAPEAARIVWTDYSPSRSSTYKLTRSFQYALNFYFHRELPEWLPDQTAPGWVFALGKDESELRNRGLSCPINALRHAVIVCEDAGLPAGSSSSGQPK
ncbi:MAG TPA: glycosyltransferase family 39 protein [Candidatus Acidoferrales bacterium]|nr:glycosyltransferase family 39 protein [Candidatus Acidoferrales bacterium]